MQGQQVCTLGVLVALVGVGAAGAGPLAPDGRPSLLRELGVEPAR